MNSLTLRWGILSTANIARKNWKAIQLTGNSTVTAVASRNLEQSRRFIADCQSQAPMNNAPRAFGSYQELLDCDEVDAVYIPLPTGLRKEWVLRAAQVGKHVVCEKPCAISVDDLCQMIQACRSRGVQFMDGVMFMHSRRLDLLRQIVSDGQNVGEIRRITSSFTFRATPEFFGGNIRSRSELEPYGCLGDLGWYCIRFALWLKEWEMPEQVTGSILSEFRHPESLKPVPTSFSGELWFKGGVSASFYCSFETETEQWVKLSGTRGGVQMLDFVLPYAGTEVGFEVQHDEFLVKGCDFRMEHHPQQFSVTEASHGHPSAQETNMFRAFAQAALSGPLNAQWPESVLKTQQVMSACYNSALAGGDRIQL